MNNRAYKVVLSKGGSLQIDADELPQVLAAVGSGNPVKVRTGIFNPSYFVSVVEDEERLKAFRDEIRRRPEDYAAGKIVLRLKDSFDGVPLKAVDNGLGGNPNPARIG